MSNKPTVPEMEAPMSNDPSKAPSPAPKAPVSSYKGGTGIRRIVNALGYSVAGIKASYAHEAAFRQESWLALALTLISLFLPVSRLEHAALIGSVLLVLAVELLNSAIEAVVDRVSLERHELSKRAKDAGSAAVLMTLLNVAVVWGFVLWGMLR